MEGSEIAPTLERILTLMRMCRCMYRCIYRWWRSKRRRWVWKL